MLSFFNKIYNKKVSSRGLAVFRILFSATLFFEVLRIYNYKELYYGTFPDLSVSPEISTYLIVWLVVLALLTVGLLSKIMTIINYVLALFLLSKFEGLIYHMAYTYLGVGFLMMLFPLSKSFSIDALLRKRYSLDTISGSKVSVLAYYLILLAGIGFVYLDSIFFKLKSEVWMNGTGMWLPASLPHFTILKDQWFLNQKFLLLFLGYLTVVFEASFCFLFFIKKIRIPVLIIGLGLHLGILIEFPIPYFAIGAVAIYVLMVPLKFFECIPVFGENNFLIAKTKERSLVRNFLSVLYYSKIPKSIARYGYIFIIAILFLLQFNSTFNFPINTSIEKKALLISENLGPFFKKMKEYKKSGRSFSKKYLGITAHGVFVDGHYNGFEKIYTLSHNDTLLPIYSSEGLPQRYLNSGSWVHYNFRVNMGVDKQTHKNLKTGLARYALFWCIENNLEAADIDFEVKEKKVYYSFKWEKDLLKKNLEEPWFHAGSINFEDGKANLTLTHPINEN